MLETINSEIIIYSDSPPEDLFFIHSPQGPHIFHKNTLTGEILEGQLPHVKNTPEVKKYLIDHHLSIFETPLYFNIMGKNQTRVMTTLPFYIYNELNHTFRFCGLSRKTAIYSNTTVKDAWETYELIKDDLNQLLS